MATIRVQFNVTNYGTVNVADGAQYRQDGNAGATIFTNEATRIPSRFIYGGLARGELALRLTLRQTRPLELPSVLHSVLETRWV